MTKRKPGSKYPDRGVTTHTVASLMARCVEVGDCCEWQGYASTGVPMVSHGGKMTTVRRLICDLQGRPLGQDEYAVPSCGNDRCVCPDHIKVRSGKQHYRAMGKLVDKSGPMRAARLTVIARATKAKLTLEQAREIRLSEESGPALARRYGINRSLVARIRRNEAWRDDIGNPFARLAA